MHKGVAFFGLIIVLGFAFVRWGCGHALGIRGIGDLAGLPLLAALLTTTAR